MKCFSGDEAEFVIDAAINRQPAITQNYNVLNASTQSATRESITLIKLAA